MHKRFSKFTEDLLKQIKDFINKMSDKLKEETNNKLTELSKII